MIDYDFKNDVAASASRQRFITLNVKEDAPPESARESVQKWGRSWVSESSPLQGDNFRIADNPKALGVLMF